MSQLDEDRAIEELAELLAELVEAQQRRRVQAVVSAVTGPTVTLLIGGSSTPQTGVHHLASYTPTAGDTVWVDFQGSDPLVLGKQA